MMKNKKMIAIKAIDFWLKNKKESKRSVCIKFEISRPTLDKYMKELK